MSKNDIDLKENNIRFEAEKLYGRYRPQIDLLEKSMLAKVRTLTPYDVYALGKQLESFQVYQKICEESGNSGQLGKIPDIALDVISVVFGTSIIPVVASVQTIDEERGLVYFKRVRGEETRGNVTAGDILRDPRILGKTPQGYASNQIFSESGGSVTQQAATANQRVTGTIANTPIQPQSIRMILADGSDKFATDFNLEGTGPNGKIVGAGITGTINYETGAFDLVVAGEVAAATNLLINYRTNYELSEDVPRIQADYDTKQIVARVYVLKSVMGMLQSYSMQKRFGLVAEDETARDLIGEINAEIGADMVRHLSAQSPDAASPVVWDRTAPLGVSAFEHKQSFKDALAILDTRIATRAGRGIASVYVAGAMACSLIQTLPGFNMISDGTNIGPHVFGTLDGKTVIRVSEQAILDKDEVIALWKGVSPFEAAAVYAPYMPLVMTSTLPHGINPLQSQRAAAVWAGIDTLCPNFITTLKIANSDKMFDPNPQTINTVDQTPATTP